MNRNYNTPTVSPEWADTRNTDMVVAMAIHAIADSSRTAEVIWEAPTSAEYDNVVMAVQEYTENCDFPAQPDGYCWGDETIFA